MGWRQHSTQIAPHFLGIPLSVHDLRHVYLLRVLHNQRIQDLRILDNQGRQYSHTCRINRLTCQWTLQNHLEHTPRLLLFQKGIWYLNMSATVPDCVGAIYCEQPMGLPRGDLSIHAMWGCYCFYSTYYHSLSLRNEERTSRLLFHVFSLRCLGTTRRSLREASAGPNRLPWHVRAVFHPDLGGWRPHVQVRGHEIWLRPGYGRPHEGVQCTIGRRHWRKAYQKQRRVNLKYQDR